MNYVEIKMENSETREIIESKFDANDEVIELLKKIIEKNVYGFK